MDFQKSDKIYVNMRLKLQFKQNSFTCILQRLLEAFKSLYEYAINFEFDFFQV